MRLIPRLLLFLAVASLASVAGCSMQAASWTGATIAGETVYLADLQQVVALDATSGARRWAFPQNPREDSRGIFYAAPAAHDSYVIAASQIPSRGFFSRSRDVVWGLDASTGAERWQFDDAAGQYLESGAIGGGIFVIGNSDGNVYALDVASGALRWTFATGHRVWAPPLIISNTVYIGSMDRHLYALDLESGREQWRFPAGEGTSYGAFASRPAFHDGVLYIGAFDNRFYAIDAETGAERWRFPPAGEPAGAAWFWSNPAVYSNTVYAADVSGIVYALNAGNGALLWSRSLDDPIRGGLVLTEDGTRLFVGSQNGSLHALDSATGRELWVIENEGQLLSTPVISGTTLYEPLLYGAKRLRALHVENGYEMWAYSPSED